MAHSSLQKYRQVKVSSVAEMTPYEQVGLIFTTIIGKLTAAKGAIDRQHIATKGTAISECITLFGALQEALDMNQEGGIAANLYELYDYCKRQLLDANQSNNKDTLDEVIRLVKEIKEGWESIPVAERNPAR